MQTQGEQREWSQSHEGAVPPQSDPDAFSAAFIRFSPALYDFLARLSGRPEAAEALLRQAASQAAMSVASAPQWPSVRAWLFARAAALLPAGNAANANPALFGDLNPALLHASPPDSGLPDMTRVVWRAVSALSTDQHALLHLHIRGEMNMGELASVLGITEHDAAQRLDRVMTAVEETSRALFLIRYGRGRDPRLNELLADHNVTRLTPELRGFLEDYLRTTPSAQAMLDAVPAPLAVYAAFRPVPIPEALGTSAATGALPWLASAASAAPAAASATTVLPEQDAGAMTEAFSPQAPTPDANLTYGYGANGQTAITPTAPPNGYNAHPYGAGGYDPYAFDGNTGYSAPPNGSGAIEGTQMLDIPVRQRVVEARSTAFVPPQRPPPPRGLNPLAILGAVGGALVVIIGALVIFLSRGASQPNARVTATVNASVTPSVAVSVVPDALLTSTAISLNRVLTVTALAATPTAIPAVIPPIFPLSSPTPAPQSVVTGVANGTPSGSPIASLSADTPAAVASLPPRITQAPVETFGPRVTSIPTRAVGTRAATPDATARGTAVTTVSVTTAPTVVTTAAPTTAPVAVVTAPPATAVPTMLAATATAVKPTVAPAGSAAATAPTAPAGSATVAMVRPVTIPTPNTPPVSASNSFVTIGTSDSGSSTLTNKSAATSFTAASNNSHITVSPASGNLAAGGSAGLTISVNRAGLSAGPYSGAVNVTTGNGNVTIIVSFTVA